MRLVRETEIRCIFNIWFNNLLLEILCCLYDRLLENRIDEQVCCLEMTSACILSLLSSFLFYRAFGYLCQYNTRLQSTFSVCTYSWLVDKCILLTDSKSIPTIVRCMSTPIAFLSLVKWLPHQLYYCYRDYDHFFHLLILPAPISKC